DDQRRHPRARRPRTAKSRRSRASYDAVDGRHQSRAVVPHDPPLRRATESLGPMKTIEISSRREFIQTVGCLAGALAALGISPEALAAPGAIIDTRHAGADET